MTRPNPPLWRAMDNSYDTSVPPPGVDWENHHGYAAELRAIADWLVPEEPRGNVVGIETRDDWARIVMRDERQRLRALLLAEADRAEAGE